MKINLSKSRYCAGLQCAKILWMDCHKSEEKDVSGVNQARFETGTKVGALAREYFGEYALIPYSDDKKVMLTETERLLFAKTTVICEASFACEAGFCSVDILRYRDDGFEIVEVKSSTGVKEEHIDDMAFQYHVLESCGLIINKVYLMYINNKYVRLGDLDIQGLFALEDCTKKVEEKQKKIADNIKLIKVIAEAEYEPDIPIGKHCDKPYPCPYKKYCFKDKIEVKPSENKPPFVDKLAIKAFLDALSYPLYFLDFETLREAVPSFDNQSPYQQIPFQYSLHIQKEPDAQIDHLEFLAQAGTDPRRAIAEKLCADIPVDVCVLAWFMSFEKGRIKELADLFPDLAPHLMAIHTNIKDLIVPFKQHAWQSAAQEGSNSIKAVLPAMFADDKELDYHNLDLVHNGNEAADTFVSLPEKTPEEQERIRAALLVYCRLDTLAMVKILQKLRDAV